MAKGKRIKVDTKVKTPGDLIRLRRTLLGLLPNGRITTTKERALVLPFARRGIDSAARTLFRKRGGDPKLTAGAIINNMSVFLGEVPIRKRIALVREQRSIGSLRRKEAPQGMNEQSRAFLKRAFDKAAKMNVPAIDYALLRVQIVEATGQGFSPNTLRIKIGEIAKARGIMVKTVDNSRAARLKRAANLLPTKEERQALKGRFGIEGRYGRTFLPPRRRSG